MSTASLLHRIWQNSSEVNCLHESADANMMTCLSDDCSFQRRKCEFRLDFFTLLIYSTSQKPRYWINPHACVHSRGLCRSSSVQLSSSIDSEAKGTCLCVWEQMTLGLLTVKVPRAKSQNPDHSTVNKKEVTAGSSQV